MMTRRNISNFKFATGMAGLSVVELMVAMVLGLTLAIGVVEIYTGSNATERSRDARSRIQENARFALNYLSEEIQAAGYLGCQSNIQDDSNINLLDAPPAHFQPEVGLQGWEANGTDVGAVFNSIDGLATVSSTGGSWDSTGGNTMPALQAVPGSDILRTWNTSGDIGILNSVSDTAVPVLNISAIDISVGDVLLLNDCEQANWVQACSVTDGVGNSLDVTLGTGCNPGNIVNPTVTVDPGAEVMKLEGTVLYVGKRNNSSANTPTLFRARLGNTASPTSVEELIEGVESIQLLYGINTDADNRSSADSYLPADQVPAANWGDVISVRVSLLMQSNAENILPASQAYRYNGVTYDGSGGNGSLPQDRRVRRTFNSTVSLRNRVLGQ